MKAYKNTSVIIICLAVMSLLFCSCKKSADPYEGMVRVPNGGGGEMWVRRLDGLALSSFAKEDFFADGSYIGYSGEEYTALRGIDVSEHQLEIDWDAVARDGVEFAVIRSGYRGYGGGSLNEDIYFRRNIDGALGAGLKAGIYFFSQAISNDEAREEARYLLGQISGYDITLPVFFDWEPIGYDEGARTEGTTGRELTDYALAFCEVIEDAGYEAGVYFYRSLGYNDYELDRLAGLVFWSAAAGDYPDFYYAHTFWQYSFTGRVSGIETETDLDMLFVKTMNN